MRWYPAASSFFTAATRSSSESLIPIETPEAISSRTPPSSFANGTSFCLASASHTADSSAAFAMLCPRTGSNMSQTSAAPENSFPRINDQRWSRKMCQAVSVVSGLYVGVSPATHSPHPLTPSTSASTNTMRRSSVRFVLVSNGVTSFILSSRRVISRIRIRAKSPLLPFTLSKNGLLKIAPRRQKIRRAFPFAANTNRCVPSSEPFRELFAHPRLHLSCALYVLFPKLAFRRHFNRRGRIAGRRRQVLYCRNYARRV